MATTRAGRIWSVIDAILWTLAIVGAVGIAVAVQVGGLQVTRVLSPSMEPTFEPGDLVIIRPIDASDLQVGDVPMLPDPDVPQIQYVHRVMRVDASRPGEVWVVTKGDNNPGEDSPVTIVTEQVPVVVATIPMSKLPLDKLSWTWSLVLLGAMAVAFLALLFAPSRRSDVASLDVAGVGVDEVHAAVGEQRVGDDADDLVGGHGPGVDRQRA
jgi:signal peptidase I